MLLNVHLSFAYVVDNVDEAFFEMSTYFFEKIRHILYLCRPSNNMIDMSKCKLFLFIGMILCLHSCETGSPHPGLSVDKDELQNPIKGDDHWDDDKTGGNFYSVPDVVREHLKDLYRRADGMTQVQFVREGIVVDSCSYDQLMNWDFESEALPVGDYVLRIYFEDYIEEISFALE